MGLFFAEKKYWLNIEPEDASELPQNYIYVRLDKKNRRRVVAGPERAGGVEPTVGSARCCLCAPSDRDSGAMQRLDGGLVCSASDLVGFLACDHLLSLELGVLDAKWSRPFRRDPVIDFLSRKGMEHEQAVLEDLRGSGLGVRELPFPKGAGSVDDLRQAQETTLAAMREGVDVVYQGTLVFDGWRGHPDFLLRVDRPSELGDWSYEVADAKLSRRVKANAVLQMCLYSDGVNRLQGVAPERLQVATGDGQLHPHRVNDYAAYYRHVRARFEDRLLAEGVETYPDPVDHCRVCRWSGRCAAQRREDDHLSRVAGITKSQTKALVEGGIPTLTALADADDKAEVEGIKPDSLLTIRRQARLQQVQYEDGKVRYELIEPREEDLPRGLAALPAPSPGDLFFDLESDQWAQDGGLEYLFGTVEEVDGEPRFRSSWAHDAEQEKRAFEGFIDDVMERLTRDPGMHVYHYGPYEEVTLKRLMGRYGTREAEVDQLLRGEVLVDLYRIVRQGVRVSEESYSLKKVEHLYMEEREGPVTEAGFSVLEYERWIEEQDDAILDEIEAYNRDDCISTWKLRAWLEERRVELETRLGLELGRPVVPEGEPPEEVAKAAAEVQLRVEALTAGVPADPSLRTRDQQGRWLLAQLLDWHRREAKPQWWAYYDSLGKSEEELRDSSDALAGLECEGAVGTVKRSTVHRYQYDPEQEHKFSSGDVPIDPATGEAAGTVVAVNHAAGLIDLKRGFKSQVPHPHCLIPPTPVRTTVLRRALLGVADAVIEHGLDGLPRFRAARDLLLRDSPRISGLEADAVMLPEGEDLLEAARSLGGRLEATYLPIQGPPGSGKTYTAARMITKLVGGGEAKVAVTATSHRAITNLVDEICAAGREEDLEVRVIQRASEEDASQARFVEPTDRNPRVRAAIRSNDCQVAAGTPWLFARPEMADLFDVLFVDEAGQMSLANVIALAGCARSIVLLGDPNQLPQVTQGTHPDGAAASSLEHVLDGSQTLAPDRGIFLADSWRMHEDVCGYISEAFYEGRLASHPTASAQQLERRDGAGGTGLLHAPAIHLGRSARSPEEAARVREAVQSLLGLSWTDHRGADRVVTPGDLLIVAPYNAQVGQIAATLDGILPRDRVGTVDKFQGQEAAVALYSMTTSTPEDAPRQMEFLYSRNRLNVAVSRARCRALVVCSPDLLLARCRTPEQMRMVNALCRFMEMAEPHCVSAAPGPA